MLFLNALEFSLKGLLRVRLSGLTGGEQSQSPLALSGFLGFGQLSRTNPLSLASSAFQLVGEMLFGFGPHPREIGLESLGRFQFRRFTRIAGGLAKAVGLGLRCCDRFRQLPLGLLAHLSDLRGQSCVGDRLCFFALFAREARRFFAFAVRSFVGLGELRGQSLLRLGLNSLGFFGESLLIVCLQPGEFVVKGALRIEFSAGEDLIPSLLPDLLRPRVCLGEQHFPGVFGLPPSTLKLRGEALVAFFSEPREFVLECLFRSGLGGVFGLA